MTDVSHEPATKENLAAHWLLLSSIAIAGGSVAYWMFNTGRSVDEFITALSWGSLIAIVIGGMASFGASIGASFSRFRKDPIEERRQNLESAKQAKPAAFGMISAGILFLCITVAIEWVALR